MNSKLLITSGFYITHRHSCVAITAPKRWRVGFSLRGELRKRISMFLCSHLKSKV